MSGAKRGAELLQQPRAGGHAGTAPEPGAASGARPTNPSLLRVGPAKKQHCSFHGAFAARFSPAPAALGAAVEFWMRLPQHRVCLKGFFLPFPSCLFSQNV